MMISIITGNIFNSRTQVIAHQVNCMGVMGAGIAKQIKTRFPDVYDEYVKYCHVNKGGKLLGDCQLVKSESGRYIANLFGQYNFSMYHISTSYPAIEHALKNLKTIMQLNHLDTLAIPYGMSCGLAGGDWWIISDLINEIFNNSSINVQIWNLKKEK